MARIYNFSAGPAVLPVEVLEEAQRDLVELPGVGMSVLEISHRSKPFDEIMQGAQADIRALAGIHRATKGGLETYVHALPARIRKEALRGRVREAIDMPEQRFRARFEHRYRLERERLGG